MRQANAVVFDERLADTALREGAYRISTTTGLEHAELLSRAGRMGLHVVADVALAPAPQPLTIAVEQSADGREWRRRGDEPALAGTLAQGTTSLVGGDPSPHVPRQRFVRLRIDVGDGRHPFDMQLRVLVTARGRSPAHADCSCAPAPERAAPLRRETLVELHGLAREAHHADAGTRLRHVLDHLSPRSRRELESVAKRLASMDSSELRLMEALARGLATASARRAPGQDGDR